MRKPLVIMMARWPGIGQGKTRLAASTSPARAANIQRHSLAALIARLGHDQRWDFALALTPTTAWRRARRHRLYRKIRLIDQGRGDLGARMTGLFREHRQHRRRPVIIIGSDTPAIAPTDILAAHRALRRHAIVFGPAEDGGYWLLGWSGARLSHHPHGFPPLAPVRWSTDQARADTVQALARFTQKTGQVFLLRSRIDIDDSTALRAAGPIRRLCPR